MTDKRLAAIVATLVATISVVSIAAEDALLDQARGLFKPLPKDVSTTEYPVSPERVALGRLLFFDPRISLDGTVSCAKCHQPALYGTDALPKSIGVKDRMSPRNAPTVLNTALQFVQHFGGNRKNVEDQATKALIGPPSFGNPDFDAAVARLKAIPGYRPLFQNAFPGEVDPITAENWGKAIGAYERTLVTPAPFDRYLQGDQKAISQKSKMGLKKFVEFGCAGCHNGVTVGGQTYQKFGITQEYWLATGSKEIDKGRYNDTKDPNDLYLFKVPPLRNVTVTPPYFHDGSVAKVEDAVRIMAKVQLGRELSNDDVGDLIAFLDSLKGELPRHFAEAPELPPIGFAAD